MRIRRLRLLTKNVSLSSNKATTSKYNRFLVNVPYVPDLKYQTVPTDCYETTVDYPISSRLCCHMKGARFHEIFLKSGNKLRI